MSHKCEIQKAKLLKAVYGWWGAVDQNAQCFSCVRLLYSRDIHYMVTTENIMYYYYYKIRFNVL